MLLIPVGKRLFWDYIYAIDYNFEPNYLFQSLLFWYVFFQRICIIYGNSQHRDNFIIETLNYMLCVRIKNFN